MDSVNMKFEKHSSNTCSLIFTSEVEGIATTYANLYRRSLLQSVPSISVAGIRCYADGAYIKNLFEVVPGLTCSLLDINTRLHSAKFDIDAECDKFVLTICISDVLKMSDLCNSGKYVIGDGLDSKVKSIQLMSEDLELAKVVGGVDITLDIFFKRGVGYSPKDINKQTLGELLGASMDNSKLKDWIITDSQHRGVNSVSYNTEQGVGGQTIILGVSSYQNNIESIVNNCTDKIINQLESFRL